MRLSMRAVFFGAFGFLICAGSAQAQWVFNGAKIYYNAGKVGIGTANPNSPLTIVSAIGSTDRPTLLVKMTDSSPEPNNAAVRAINRGQGGNGIGVWGSHDGNGWGVYGTSDEGIGAFGECVGIGGIGVRGEGGTDGYGVYGSAPSSGGIGVFGDGASAAGYGGYFNGRGYFSGNLGLDVESPTFLLHLGSDSAAKPTSNTWTISSDRRLKMNIRTIEHALDDLLALRGVTYQWRDPSAQGNMAGTYTGMIAQDVENVFPEWVREDADGYKTLTVIGFEGIVVEALRELRAEKDAEIEALQFEKDSEIAELRAMVEALHIEVARLSESVTAMQPGGAHPAQH